MHTWMALLSGNVKSLPQVPGKIPSPNSPPASLEPKNLNFPGAEVGVEPPEVVVGPGLLGSEPGRH